MSSTVIIGGGIIGASIAYYLSDPNVSTQKREIHIIDTSPELFASASGYAAGFLARNWFSPELETLGELSFKLHRELAERQSGRETWGYANSTAVSLQVKYTDGQKSKREHDWLRHGASRAEVAVRERAGQDPSDPSPAWLTKQRGGVVEQISDEGSAAQVNPLPLCRFLIDSCRERGVQVHYPARAVSFTTDDCATISSVAVERLDTQTTSRIPCTDIVFAAGAWTAEAFKSLFPLSRARIPVSSLAGHSLLLRSPRHTLQHELETYGGNCHAVFTTHPKSSGFSAEIFSRAGGEIYIAGLNSSTTPLPKLATDARAMVDPKSIARMRQATTTLMGKAPANADDNDDEAPNIDDLEVVREALCFRPWTESGLPIVARIDEAVPQGIRLRGGAFMAAGHGPWGICLSLGTGKVVAEMVAGQKTSADVSGLGLEQARSYL